MRHRLKHGSTNWSPAAWVSGTPTETSRWGPTGGCACCAKRVRKASCCRCSMRSRVCCSARRKRKRGRRRPTESRRRIENPHHRSAVARLSARGRNEALSGDSGRRQMGVERYWSARRAVRGGSAAGAAAGGPAGGSRRLPWPCREDRGAGRRAHRLLRRSEREPARACAGHCLHPRPARALRRRRGGLRRPALGGAATGRGTGGQSLRAGVDGDAARRGRTGAAAHRRRAGRAQRTSKAPGVAERSGVLAGAPGAGAARCAGCSRVAERHRRQPFLRRPPRERPASRAARRSRQGQERHGVRLRPLAQRPDGAVRRHPQLLAGGRTAEGRAGPAGDRAGPAPARRGKRLRLGGRRVRRGAAPAAAGCAARRKRGRRARPRQAGHRHADHARRAAAQLGGEPGDAGRIGRPRRRRAAGSTAELGSPRVDALLPRWRDRSGCPSPTSRAQRRLDARQAVRRQALGGGVHEDGVPAAAGQRSHRRGVVAHDLAQAGRLLRHRQPVRAGRPPPCSRRGRQAHRGGAPRAGTGGGRGSGRRRGGADHAGPQRHRRRLPCRHDRARPLRSHLLRSRAAVAVARGCGGRIAPAGRCQAALHEGAATAGEECARGVKPAERRGAGGRRHAGRCRSEALGASRTAGRRPRRRARSRTDSELQSLLPAGRRRRGGVRSARWGERSHRARSRRRTPCRRGVGRSLPAAGFHAVHAAPAVAAGTGRLSGAVGTARRGRCALPVATRQVDAGGLPCVGQVDAAVDEVRCAVDAGVRRTAGGRRTHAGSAPSAGARRAARRLALSAARQRRVPGADRHLPSPARRLSEPGHTRRQRQRALGSSGGVGGGGSDREHPAGDRRRQLADVARQDAGGNDLRADRAEHVAGRTASVPAGRLSMAVAAVAVGRGRLPCRRHGARQDPADAGPAARTRPRRARRWS